MKSKLPVIIAVEAVIAVLSFLIASDKTRFEEIAFLLTLITAIVAVSHFGYRRVRGLRQ
jgi:hypothetical protein